MTITGGRDFTDRDYVRHILDGMHETTRITILRHGGSKGADQLAGEWARAHQVGEQVFYAKWESEGKRAGPNRNARMLDARPVTEGLIAFPGGKGTQNCVMNARKRKIPVFDAGALYDEWLNRPPTLGDFLVDAAQQLMKTMEADEATSGLLSLDLGGKGLQGVDIGEIARKYVNPPPIHQDWREIESKGPQDVVE